MKNDMIKIDGHMSISEIHETIIDIGWEGLKDHVYPCLMAQRIGCQMAGEIVHSEFLDLYIHYYIRIEHTDEDMCVIWIGQDLLTGWSINLQTLNIQAIKNLMRDRYTIQYVGDILNSFLGGSITPDIPMDHSLYVLTNQKAFFGAAGILDDSIITAFADNVGYDLFILPSSIHEVLLLPDFGEIMESGLDQIVKEVNHIQVGPYERLSNHVYYYDRRLDEIRLRK